MLNACSYAGKTFMSATKACDYPGPRPERVRNFRAPNLSVDCLDFRQSIPRHAGDFLYMDPPYYEQPISGYYQQRSTANVFNHEALRDLLLARDNWMMSYNNHPVIRKWYEKTCDVEEVSWTYSMRVNYGRPQENKPAGHGKARGVELLVSRA